MVSYEFQNALKTDHGTEWKERPINFYICSWETIELHFVGMVAGMYAGFAYGIEKARGKQDWVSIAACIKNC